MRETTIPLRSAPQRAVARALTAGVARVAARYWSPLPAAPDPIHAVQNFAFAISLPAGRAILRLTHESHRTRAEIEAELRWLADLLDRRLPVCRPLASTQNALIHPVDSSHGQFFATCFERFPGAEPDLDETSHRQDEMFRRLGSTMARLHQATVSAGWSPALLARRSWRNENTVRNFHALVPSDETAVHQAYERVLSELDSLPATPDSFGLIHADLNHTNLLLSGERLNVFDFDDACYCWFAFDLAVPIYHLPTAEQAVMNAAGQRALQSLVRGYELVRPFNPRWLRWLPLFLKWRDLVTYAFFHEQLEIARLPEKLGQTFRAMRARIVAGRPIAEIGEAA